MATSHGTVERICRLTPLQDGMFFDALRKQGSGEVLYQVCLELAGPVRPTLLREAWRTVVRRHPILRTSFHYERLDVPVQVARRDADPAWRDLDWRGVVETDHDRLLAELVESDRRQPFELTRAPLMRLACVQASDHRFWLLWTYHHLLLDGWSMYLVLDDVSRCYRELAVGRTPDLAPTRPYWDYVAWLDRHGSTGSEEFWRRGLAGFAVPTPLGYEDVGPAGTGAEFGEVERTVPADVRTALAALAGSHRITPGSVVQAAWAVTLSRYTGCDDVVFGCVVSGRPPEFAGIDDMVGLFINMLPVRAQVADDRPLVEWLTDVQTGLVEARQHQHTPLTTIQQWSDVPRGMPLFESIAVFINYPVRESWTDGGEATVTGQRVLQQPHYPLHLTVVAGDTGWRLSLGYDATRFRRGTVERLVDLFGSVLAAVATATGRAAGPTVGDLPRWPGTTALAELAREDQAPAVAWPDLVRAVVAQRPDGVAVHAAAPLTYRALLARAERLAVRMCAAGAGPARTVELRLGMSAEFVVALTATALAGAALALDDVDGDVVCQLDAARPDGFEVAGPGGTGSPGHDPRAAVVVTNDAALTHSGLAALLWWLQRHHPMSSADTAMIVDEPAGFGAVRDVLWALAVGATVAPVTDVRGPAWGAVTVASGPATFAAGQLPPALRRLAVRPGPVPSATLRSLRVRTALHVVEEFPHGDATLRSTFRVDGQAGVAVSPAVGRRRDGKRVFPPPTGTAVTEDDPRLWSVAAVLTRHPAIRDAVAHAAPAENGRPLVTAYVVTDGGTVNAAALGEQVTARLGRELVPDRFVTLPALPVTPDGRIDVAALPTGPTRQTDRSTGQLAAMVIGVWAQVTEVPADRLDPRTDFFDIGGHSLLAIRLVSRIRSAFGIDFTLNDLFTNPTVGGCTRAVHAAMTNGSVAEGSAPIPRSPRGAPLRMSFAQERLWFLDQVVGGRANNVLLPARIGGAVNAEALRRALGAVVERHEVLRTFLLEQDGVPVQVINDHAPAVLAVDDLSALPADVAERQARALLEADVARRFDLAAETPLRARLIRLAAHDHVLGLCVHHAAFDGWSTGVLFDDLTTAYKACAEGKGDPLPGLTVQYADFAQWQRERLTGERLDRLLGYWRRQLDGVPEVLDLAPPLPSGDRMSNTRAEIDVFLPGDLVGGLDRLAAAESGTLFMALLTAYSLVLAKHARRDDVVVGAPVAGRDHPDVEGLVGFFVNVAVLRMDLSGEPTFRAVLRRVRQVCLDALTHSELPFEKLVGALRPDRVAERLALAQVAFTFQSAPGGSLEFDGRPVEHFPVRHGVARWELDLEAYPWDGGVRCVFRYAVDRYRRGLVAQLGADYLDVVRRMVADLDAPAFSRPAAPGDTGELTGASLDMLRAAAASGGEA
ncbi:condensation domain-containing protein [Actinophytocola sp.]|uniref:condensation domain-containing protein n=1 Tax=Actinophytocola sp. TaxID=1872138 RepID=UPI00389AE584